MYTIQKYSQTENCLTCMDLNKLLVSLVADLYSFMNCTCFKWNPHLHEIQPREDLFISCSDILMAHHSYQLPKSKKKHVCVPFRGCIFSIWIPFQLSFLCCCFGFLFHLSKLDYILRIGLHANINWKKKNKSWTKLMCFQKKTENTWLILRR